MSPAPDISAARGARAGVRLDRGLGPRLALAECDVRAADGEHRDEACANTPRGGRPEPRPSLPRRRCLLWVKSDGAARAVV
jgi:hypothetical protein